ncbi:hypothetical protein H1R20_g13303, partial [Candolleomyces eurysporus]
MSDGSCMKFNNATQQIFKGTVRPVVVVQETNDYEGRWFAEAMLIDHSRSNLVFLVGQGSATKKREAKDIAAKCGFEWLCSQYPEVDLSGV